MDLIGFEDGNGTAGCLENEGSFVVGFGGIEIEGRTEIVSIGDKDGGQISTEAHLT